jgi:hypothetical protein
MRLSAVMVKTRHKPEPWGGDPLGDLAGAAWHIPGRRVAQRDAGGQLLLRPKRRQG